MLQHDFLPVRVKRPAESRRVFTKYSITRGVRRSVPAISLLGLTTKSLRLLSAICRLLEYECLAMTCVQRQIVIRKLESEHSCGGACCLLQVFSKPIFTITPFDCGGSCCEAIIRHL
jgi:hypothetical protein